mmetsp:Transcript_40084/g.78029  ORF Transcript_40084/g.78029 Transcript_40084/m.78029 type:complete len:248 (+) Transcript_40084:292-1035(+)
MRCIYYYCSHSIVNVGQITTATPHYPHLLEHYHNTLSMLHQLQQLGELAGLAHAPRVEHVAWAVERRPQHELPELVRVEHDRDLLAERRAVAEGVVANGVVVLAHRVVEGLDADALAGGLVQNQLCCGQHLAFEHQTQPELAWAFGSEEDELKLFLESLQTLRLIAHFSEARRHPRVDDHRTHAAFQLFDDPLPLELSERLAHEVAPLHRHLHVVVVPHSRVVHSPFPRHEEPAQRVTLLLGISGDR